MVLGFVKVGVEERSRLIFSSFILVSSHPTPRRSRPSMHKAAGNHLTLELHPTFSYLLMKILLRMERCLIAEFEQDKITMGRVEAEICSICDKNPSKYRCPYCSVHYCSLACNKVHKSGAGTAKPPCTGKRQLVETSAQSADDETQTPAKRPKTCDSDKDAIVAAPEEETPVTAGCLRNARDQWRDGKIEEDDEEEWRMSEDQRKRLSQCEWLKTALRDPKLQALLFEIDKADDRKKTLAFHRTSTQFGEFMDKLLLEIGEYRKGGSDEPALVATDA